MAGLSAFASHRRSLRLKGGSYRMSQTPNHHLATQLLSSSTLLALTLNLKGPTVNGVIPCGSHCIFENYSLVLCFAGVLALKPNIVYFVSWLQKQKEILILISP